MGLAAALRWGRQDLWLIWLLSLAGPVGGASHNDLPCLGLALNCIFPSVGVHAPLRAQRAPWPEDRPQVRRWLGAARGSHHARAVT